jgi:hypothetical protein
VSAAELSKVIARRAADADAAAWRTAEAYINAPIPGQLQNEPGGRLAAFRKRLAGIEAGV